MATEASGGGTPDLFSVLEVLGYDDIYGCRKYVGKGGHEGPTRVDGAPRGWARPLPRALLVDLLTCTPSLPGCFPSKNNFSRRFHSVSTPFDIPFLRNTETR